ncbi:hypothetical protein Afil01_62760 [Actinorhabdospora filicis]|uniref:DUF1697 domain-containing protein n=1 Tax=Actinorhabdospora filicis TaxID=1785913 RepID=A0A9W6WCB3_9ACTN|nr:DUF1697 domain-containing protein [Actinorhabdospora filicis]GLZ81469.1 hypothetical protein Afil01_62760 [Actinorhabdospora filicis]
MTRYAALLRGINVGGKKRVPMAELRDVLSGLGYTDVTTYLNSGNATFTATGDAAELTLRVEEALAGHFGFPIDTLVVDGPYLRRVIAACPFPADELEGKQLHVTFLSEEPGERFAAVDAAAYAPEDYRLGEKAVYLYAPDGLGVSKLGVELARPRLVKGLRATSRNWNTVKALAEITGA